MKKSPPWILPVIIFSQFAGTSLWFAGNAILPDLQQLWSLDSSSLGYITSAVQLGFITGTLCFAFFAIADQFSPRWIFFYCSLAGAFSNFLVYFLAEGLISLLILRFITGFFLAGIYPVGMKIAAGWYQKGLGKALGFLVGALVLGTAFPHLLKGSLQSLNWEVVILAISGVALLGGVLMFWFVPDGPFLFKGTRFNSKAILLIFQSKDVRSAAFGYFGHMWEIYTLWAFIPVIFHIYLEKNPEVLPNISFWAFCIIAVGFVGCAGGGLMANKIGSIPVAFFQLAASAICCLFSPLFFYLPLPLFIGILLFWGIMAAGDSPQFSTSIAQTAPKELVGSALTIVNCIGFSITIVSIQLLNFLIHHFDQPNFLFLTLAIGPLCGLFFLWPLFIRSYRSPVR